jgi:hypothetical protein
MAASKKVISHEAFMEKLKLKIKGKKDFEVISRYTHNTTPILTQDRYGICEMSPNALMQGSTPSIKAALNKTEYCINKFKEVWKDRFDYSKFEYTGARVKSTIICRIHGEFLQDANMHLSGKCGCPTCAHLATKAGVTSNTDAFISKARNIHGDKYDYSLVDYKSAKSHVKIICRTHGEFLQVPNTHLSGSGCTRCGKTNVVTGNFHTHAEGRECTLYIVKLSDENEEFLKVGITSSSVEKRFSGPNKLPYNLEVLLEVKSYDYESVYYFEQELLATAQLLKYIPLKEFAGYTECLTINLRDSLINYVKSSLPIEGRSKFSKRILNKDPEFSKSLEEKGMGHIGLHNVFNLLKNFRYSDTF